MIENDRDAQPRYPSMDFLEMQVVCLGEFNSDTRHLITTFPDALERLQKYEERFHSPSFGISLDDFDPFSQKLAKEMIGIICDLCEPSGTQSMPRNPCGQFTARELTLEQVENRLRSDDVQNQVVNDLTKGENYSVEYVLHTVQAPGGGVRQDTLGALPVPPPDEARSVNNLLLSVFPTIDARFSHKVDYHMEGVTNFYRYRFSLYRHRHPAPAQDSPEIHDLCRILCTAESKYDSGF